METASAFYLGVEQGAIERAFRQAYKELTRQIYIDKCKLPWAAESMGRLGIANAALEEAARKISTSNTNLEPDIMTSKDKEGNCDVSFDDVVGDPFFVINTQERSHYYPVEGDRFTIQTSHPDFPKYCFWNAPMSDPDARLFQGVGHSRGANNPDNTRNRKQYRFRESVQAYKDYRE